MAYALNLLEEENKQVGYSLTNPYSPGYCSWPVSDQHTLFSFLPAGFCGITLTGSSLMLPIKSVSAIVGVGEQIQRVPYGCSQCNMKDCYKRKR
ncbi:MAG: hypothetical protein LUD02_05030 [Tannerellaceae bacterium]|nr:hypothetical protein [Tannerellaceae bacterium]MCD8263588.1 hypothetical protein [Tannerellaceae bacterium]